MSQPSSPPASPVVEFLRRRWLTILLVLVAGFFIFQNRNRVTVNLFWFRLTTSLWAVLLVLFLVGLIAGIITFKRRNRSS